MRHENSLSVNSLNKKKDDIPISTATGINEKRLMEITMTTQNNNTPSSDEVENVFRKDKKRKNGEEHSFNKVAKGRGQQKSNSRINEQKKIMNWRNCFHIAFRNRNNDDVNDELVDETNTTIGRALIRPCSIDNNYLVIHWNVYKYCVREIKVLEENKDSDESIGKTLIIDGEEFKNIDDIFERYVKPMNERVKAILNHEKFMATSKEEIVGKLEYKNQFRNKKGLFYFTWNCENDGYFSLMYTTQFSVKRKSISIWLDGYRCSGEMYKSINDLIDGLDLLNDSVSITRSSLYSDQGSRLSFKTSQEDVDEQTRNRSTRMNEQNTVSGICGPNRNVERNGLATSSVGNSKQEENNGDNDSDDKATEMKMITGTGKNKLKANNFPVDNDGNTSKATTLKDNEDVSASLNSSNNEQHFYMKKKQEDN